MTTELWISAIGTGIPVLLGALAVAVKIGTFATKLENLTVTVADLKKLVTEDHNHAIRRLEDRVMRLELAHEAKQ